MVLDADDASDSADVQCRVEVTEGDVGELAHLRVREAQRVRVDVEVGLVLGVNARPGVGAAWGSRRGRSRRRRSRRPGLPDEDGSCRLRPVEVCRVCVIGVIDVSYW